MRKGNVRARAASGGLKRCFHLIEIRQIAPLQDQTDIPMRDKIARAVNNVGIARLPGLDTGYDVPNMLEIDLGLKDADDRSGELLNRNGNRHVGFRILYEIDRAVVGQSF